eukprot:sb/3465523/
MQSRDLNNEFRLFFNCFGRFLLHIDLRRCSAPPTVVKFKLDRDPHPSLQLECSARSIPTSPCTERRKDNSELQYTCHGYYNKVTLGMIKNSKSLDEITTKDKETSPFSVMNMTHKVRSRSCQSSLDRRRHVFGSDDSAKSSPSNCNTESRSGEFAGCGGRALNNIIISVDLVPTAELVSQYPSLESNLAEICLAAPTRSECAMMLLQIKPEFICPRKAQKSQKKHLLSTTMSSILLSEFGTNPTWKQPSVNFWMGWPVSRLISQEPLWPPIRAWIESSATAQENIRPPYPLRERANKVLEIKVQTINQKPTETSKQPIRTCYLGDWLSTNQRPAFPDSKGQIKFWKLKFKPSTRKTETRKQPIRTCYLGDWLSAIQGPVFPDSIGVTEA